MKRSLTLSILLIIVLMQNSHAQRDYSDSHITKLVLLGTGNPNPSPHQSGCSLALLVNNTPYIIDFGPGLIRRAAALTPRYGGTLEGLQMHRLNTAFLTHLHSDHTTGYPDLVLTPWVMGRKIPMRLYGPVGSQAMTDHILKAYQEDIKYRVYGSEPTNDQGWRVECHEISEEGVVYRDSLVKVEAFPVTHGTWPNAWGYRFTTPDKVIVISGDCMPSDKVVEYARGADILVHEVYSQAGFDTKSEPWKVYHKAHHTSTLELANMANLSKPGKIILYHILYWGSTEEELLEEIKAQYSGEVFVGHDLDIY